MVSIPPTVWEGGDLLAVDRLVHAAEDRGVPLLVITEPRLLDEVSLRYQRLNLRTNEGSRTPAFDALRGRHRKLHDNRKPLVRADYEHAVDTWQWVLRLEPRASAEVQLAALLHDIERLESEADERKEHRASDYQGFKDQHARRGAEIVRELLAGGPWDVDRVVELVAQHERQDPDVDRTLMVDADVLSFFALNSAGYLAHYGLQATERKVAWSVARASERIWPWLYYKIRLPAEVRAALG